MSDRRNRASSDAKAGSRHLLDLRAGLLPTIHSEIIPHLLRESMVGNTEEPTRDAAPDPFGALVEPSVLESEALTDDRMVEDFANVLLTYDAFAALRHAETFLSKGGTVAELLLGLCAPAARLVGERWLNDECSFCEVTIAVSSLEKVILRFGSSEEHPAMGADPSRSILLGRAPGEQHLIGLLIIRELLRRDGWCVRIPPGNSARALLEAVRTTHFTVVGLSVGSTQRFKETAELVRDLRTESINQNILIMVGGAAVEGDTGLVQELGADLIAKSGREGLDQLERMVAGSRIQPHVN